MIIIPTVVHHAIGARVLVDGRHPGTVVAKAHGGIPEVETDDGRRFAADHDRVTALPVVTVRKIGTVRTAHRSEQRGTWMGWPLFEVTLCGRQMRAGDWAEVQDGTGWSRNVGVGPGYLLQPCERCARQAAKRTS